MQCEEFIERAKEYLPKATLEQSGLFYKNLLEKNYDKELLRELTKIDRWFLLVILLGKRQR